MAQRCHGDKNMVIQFAAAKVVMTSSLSENTVTLSKEQAAILLPLLPTLAKTLARPLPAQASKPSTPSETETSLSDSAQYTNAKMFTRKKKNECSTAAQNHLLVSATSLVANTCLVHAYNRKACTCVNKHFKVKFLCG